MIIIFMICLLIFLILGSDKMAEEICKYGKFDKSMTRKIICTYYHDLCAYQHMCARCGHSKMLVGRYEDCRDRVGEKLNGRNK